MTEREALSLAALIQATPIAPPGSAEREAELIRLRLASAKRAGPGRVVVDQADAGALPLFVAADEPSLF